MEDRIAVYRQLVMDYERLDEQIDALLMANGGRSENLKADDVQLYRALAQERDELQNQMRLLEDELELK